MSSRQSTPLFELLQGPREAGEEGERAPVVVEAPASPRRAPNERSSGGSGESWASRLSPGARFAGDFRAPKVWVYGVGAGLVLGFIVIWSLGVRFGESRAESRYADSLTSSLPQPLEPGPVEAGPIAGGETGSVQAASLGGGTRSASPSDGGQVGGGWVYLTSMGPVPSDPREAGSNYLKLASGVEREQAERVVAFLASRDVEAIAAPVDPRGVRANNRDRLSGRVDLYSLYGVPSERFSASGAERRRHEDRLRGLGRAWLARPEGLINFDRTQWTKFDG